MLRIAGEASGPVIYSASGVSSGTIELSGRLISYTGLEPIYDDMLLVDRVFVFGPEAETIRLEVGELRSVITSPFSELVDFVNPSGSVTIRTEGGEHTVIVSGEPVYEILVDARSGHATIESVSPVTVVPDGEQGALGAAWYDLSAQALPALGPLGAAPPLFSIQDLVLYDDGRTGRQSAPADGIRPPYGGLADWLRLDTPAYGERAGTAAEPAAGESSASSAPGDARKVDWNGRFNGLGTPAAALAPNGAGGHRGVAKLSDFQLLPPVRK
ncbi:MAG: hypothetical protein IT514_02285 [Burkholderiales bacterium]|nr:hypothetical protein [Burkholderiales bacterium]